MRNPNVLIITFDCLRPDRLSGSGYRGVSTPTFDRVMNEGVTFTNAYCQAPNTWMSHASLFTGCNPYKHGVRTPVGKISDRVQPMAELFQKARYDTFGLPALSLLSRETGFARGFVEYRLDGMREETERYSRFRTSADTLDIAKTWLEHTNRPFFAWIHYFGTHWLPAELLDLPHHYRRSYSEYAQFYDGKVVQADEQFLAPLLDHLQALEVLDETVLVLMSDHGDDLGQIELKEQGLLGSEGHLELTEQVMRILLTIRAPGLLAEGEKRADICQSIDVLPTLLELTGLKSAPNQYEGRSLVSPLSQANPPVIYMENLCWGFVGIRSGRFKLVLSEPGRVQRKQGRPAGRVRLLKDTAWRMLPRRWQRWFKNRRSNRNEPKPWWKKVGEPDEVFARLMDSGACELYDLAEDPAGKNNIATEHPQIVLEYQEMLRDIASRSAVYQSGYETVEEESEIEERLKSLGYF